ncbi:hypothetical protein SISSUDRAFT_1053759 [Sistotremastrum suecicum HHB10207 ss-3]|uniref:Uncharacterized protein n=1 Tax=Sistotremastrum suecicum HHB10207 ss-3 TaxID=1314776 RepID=A0A165Z1H9_9AGAM|nr:hypothetical protein SISSUDRAFT_1053759 [Sistotremastrum suecicum HHB10207 ss-3]
MRRRTWRALSGWFGSRCLALSRLLSVDRRTYQVLLYRGSLRIQVEMSLNEIVLVMSRQSTSADQYHIQVQGAAEHPQEDVDRSSI